MYPQIPDFHRLVTQVAEYSSLKHEYGAEGVSDILKEAESALKIIISKIKELPNNTELEKLEPDNLMDIRKLRTDGPRRIWTNFNRNRYMEKLEGAIIARFAGCTLGAAVEFWSIEKMEEWAKHIGDQFPPVDYWSKITNPIDLRYDKSLFEEYTRDKMDGVPVDDDITYTILDLLIAEEQGLNFTTSDVGKAWLKYLPYACTAEDVALRNLKAGIPAMQAADIDNPYCQWIGADIRSDGWAYMAPAYPEKAAEMAYKDAYLSHRRNGIYGEMFFSAVQSAAFAVDNAIDAIKIGLSEIPKGCILYKEVIWALEAGKDIKNYREARQAVDNRFNGMSGVHTNNNACLTIFGLMMGGNDVTKVISNIVAMGLDNDCTAATAGSIVGAIVGKDGIPAKWYKNFNNKVRTYLINQEWFEIDNLIERYAAQAEKLYSL